ncbi:MAG: LpqB family beta-propeller domain-containing protein [Vicinamibacterales bacterium]
MRTGPSRCSTYVLLALAGGALTGSAARTQSPRPIALDDYLAIKSVSGVAVSPDGAHAAYVVREVNVDEDRRDASLWRVPVAGGPPRRLTQTGSVSAPAWSPDGRHLAFLSDRGDKTQVWVLPAAGGEAFRVTDVKQGVETFEWAPDSARLALVITDPDPLEGVEKKTGADKAPRPIVVTRLQHKQDGEGYLDRRKSHLYVADAKEALASAGARFAVVSPLTWGIYDERRPAWSPDGRLVAFSSNRTDHPDANDNTDIFTIEPATGRITQLTKDPGGEDNPVWSPDGRDVAFIHMPKDPPVYATPRVWSVPATGGRPHDWTGAFDRHAGGGPRWSRDGQSIFVTLVDQGRTPIVRVSRAGRRLGTIDGDFGALELTRTHLVATSGAPTRPTDIVSVALAGGATENLSRANDTLFASLRLAPAEEIHYTSADGTPIEGWIVKPPDFDPAKKYPLIVRIHGGPVSQYTDSFSFEHQYLASLGYVVLFTNPRGSSGYGEAFSRAILADWGNKDYEDVMAGVDHLLKMGFADERRMGVGGWSYGGILTNYIITKSTRFAAAISGASEADMFSAFGYDDLQRWWVSELGHPWDQAELYRKLSPIYDVKKVTTPTLVMCGEKDFRCPLPQSEQLYLALKTLGKETALIIYPGQSHSIRRPSYEIDRYRRYGFWYDKFLKGAAVDPTYDVLRKTTTP